LVYTRILFDTVEVAGSNPAPPMMYACGGSSASEWLIKGQAESALL